MSLAMYAAPFDNEINTVRDDNTISRKRALNKTQKRTPSPKENNYSEKVNSVLQTIHNLPSEDEPLADFNPPPPPHSSGVENTRLKENSQPTNGLMDLFVGQPSQNSKPQFLSDIENGGNENGGNENNSYLGEFGNNNHENYQRYMPNYNEMYNRNNTANQGQGQSYAHNSYQSSGDKNDILIEKLNYMIKLLEDQQDEKTGNVTEEVILYSFLGIFIIFVVDSFARVGKYVR
jgi:hypothetical protein